MNWRYKVALFLTVGTICLSKIQAACFLLNEGYYDLGYEYRQDNLSWNIAGPQYDPDILSELDWKDLKINQIVLKTGLVTCSGWCFRAHVDYGEIFQGQNRDSDYFASGRQDEYSRVLASAGSGEVFDLFSGIGYRWSFCNRRFLFASLVGVSWHEQHLEMYDGVQVIPSFEQIEGLDSTYKTRWYGCWLGYDLSINACRNFNFFHTFEYHWANYRGVGNWNLREDFIGGFHHYANGQGCFVNGGVDIRLYKDLSIAVYVSYQSWCAKNGTHSVTMFDEEGVVVERKTRLNSVIWNSLQVGVSFTSLF